MCPEGKGHKDPDFLLRLDISQRWFFFFSYSSTEQMILKLSRYSFPDEEFAAPFHPPCFQVFAQALRYLRSGRVAGIAESEEVSKELLYEAMKRSYGGNYEPHLELDYGELGDVNSEQYWDNVPGYEVCLFPSVYYRLLINSRHGQQTLYKVPPYLNTWLLSRPKLQ